MSDYLSAAVWASDLDGDLKPLAAALANCGSDDGTSIFPSIAYMAWKLSRSERAIQSSLKRLKEMSVVVVLAHAKGGRSKTPHYRLCEENLPKRAPWKSPTTSLGKGEVCDSENIKGEVCDDKGCSLEQERVKPTAPDGLLEEQLEENSTPTPFLEGRKEGCEKCGSVEEGHKCPGHLTAKQRAKRAGQKIQALGRKRIPFDTERPPRYDRPSYPPRPQGRQPPAPADDDSEFPLADDVLKKWKEDDGR